MHRLVLTMTVLALCAGGFAQTTTKVTSPPGFENLPAVRYGYAIPHYMDGHFQFADANFKGKGIKVINQVAYRHDNFRTYTDSGGMGRSWTNVTLKISDTDYASMSATFSTNVKGLQTKIYDAALSMASKSGRTSPFAQPFTALVIPFSSGALYMGTKDLLFEYELQGGTLANNGMWSTSGQTYYLDSAVTTSYANALVDINITSTNCRDSAITNNLYSYCQPILRSYNAFSPTTYRNKIRFQTQSYRTAASKPVIHVLGIKGQAPVTFPGAEKPCDNLQLDLSYPFLFLPPLMAGSTGTASSPYLWVGYDPALVGLQLFMQAAWNDSLTGNLRISNMATSAIPAVPIPHLNKCLRVNNRVSPTGSLLSSSYIYNPVYELTYQ